MARIEDEIKQAVDAPAENANLLNAGYQQISRESENMAENYDETMQPSIMNEAPVPQSPEQSQEQYAQYPQEYQQAQAPPQDYQYQDYQPTGISTDAISEIAEQIAEEKISPMKKSVEKLIDSKTNMEAKLSFIDERLKRIENMIDRMQLSILQKVGDYVNNVEDIKKEMIETQKSFKAMHHSRVTPASPHHHEPHHQGKHHLPL